MSLEYILRRFKQKTGLASNTPDARTYCLDYINEGALELYEATDLTGCLQEVILKVYADRQVSLPSFVGVPRAMREYSTLIPWKLSSMRPRYNENSWPKDSFRNFRDKFISPVAVDVTNYAPPKVSVPFVEDVPIEITIIGSTDNSARVIETKVINALEVQFDTPFTSYSKITKNRTSAYDTIILDADGNEISVIYNDELEANYRIIDVSAFQFSASGEDNSFLMELLFKSKFKRLLEDKDEFLVPGYDDVIINKAVQLFSEDNGKVDKATMFDQKATRTARRKSDDQNKGKTISVDPSEHPHDRLLNRTRKYWRRYD